MPSRSSTARPSLTARSPSNSPVPPSSTPRVPAAVPRVPVALSTVVALPLVAADVAVAVEAVADAEDVL